MRIVRCELDDEDYSRSGDTAYELRILLNRPEAAVIDAIRQARSLWSEHVARLYGRAVCKTLRRHNVFCRTRSDHFVLGVGLIDPERWHYRPRS